MNVNVNNYVLNDLSLSDIFIITKIIEIEKDDKIFYALKNN